MVSGVGLNAFWISSYLWDVTSLIPAVAFTLIVLAAADVEALMDGEAASATVLLFVMFGFSSVRCTRFLYIKDCPVLCVLYFMRPIV